MFPVHVASLTLENYCRIEMSFQPGPSVTAVMMRHLSPRTFTKLINSLPIEGAIRREGPLIIALLNLAAHFDKTKDSFERGEIAYDPKNMSLCIVVEQAKGIEMVPIGKINEVELLNSIGRTGWLSIRRIQ